MGPNVAFNPWLTTSDLISGICNGGTAHGNKQLTLATLTALPTTGDKKVDEPLAKAICMANRFPFIDISKEYIQFGSKSQ